MSKDAKEVMESSDSVAEENVEETASPVPVLPLWLRKALPEPLPHTVLSWQNEKLHFSHNGAEFADYESAYEYANLLYEAYELILDPSLEGHSGHFLGDSHEVFFVQDTEEDGEKYTYMTLYSYSLETREETLAKAFKKWMTVTAPEYDAKPEDFFSAYKFVSEHPIFWVVQDADSAAHSWITHSGLDGQRVEVYPSESGDSHVFSVSIDGQHKRGENYKTRLSHPNPSGTARSYEEAIIALAKGVRETYSLDGTPRISF